jgi:REP element-mobilizing transposase RayT
MTRPLRNDVEGIHHVYARGNNRSRIFRDDDDRNAYLATLASVTIRMRWRMLAYCLMSNHVHLLIETREPNLGSGIQRLHGAYARTYNDRYRHTGHVFEGRFGSRLVESDEQLWGAIAYIAQNPVKAGLCATPEQHPWSSHSLVTKGRAPRWLDERRLFEHFAGTGGDPRRRYEELIEGRAGVSPDSARPPGRPRRAPASSPM